VDFAEDYGVDEAEDPAFGCDVDGATDPESEVIPEEFCAALAFLTGVEASPKYYDQSDDDDESEDESEEPAFETGDECTTPAFDVVGDTEAPAFDAVGDTEAPAFDAVGDTEAPAFDAGDYPEDYLFDADDPAFDAYPESLPDPLLLPLYISA
jgi:hypothetical protein